MKLETGIYPRKLNVITKNKHGRSVCRFIDVKAKYNRYNLALIPPLSETYKIMFWCLSLVDVFMKKKDVSVYDKLDP